MTQASDDFSASMDRFNKLEEQAKKLISNLKTSINEKYSDKLGDENVDVKNVTSHGVILRFGGLYFYVQLHVDSDITQRKSYLGRVKIFELEPNFLRNEVSKSQVGEVKFDSRGNLEFTFENFARSFKGYSDEVGKLIELLLQSYLERSKCGLEVPDWSFHDISEVKRLVQKYGD